MSFFNNISSQEFVSSYWQQHPVLIRDAFKDLIDVISGDELAGLACEAQVESRIISGFDIDDDWRCQHGPFNADDFTSLPERNWTLLVQGLDQWDDDVRAILDRFEFLPRWRVEDIMASYAPMGGGVGPHFDYYDVFLIQVTGERKWRLGQDCNEQSALQDNDQVRLLAGFSEQKTYTVKPGDVLYLPPGVAHWGRSESEDCITLSVGFRAPAEKELLTEALELVTARMPAQKRFKDTTSSIDSHPYKINSEAQKTLTQMIEELDASDMQRSISRALGQLVTETRYQLFVEDESHWQTDDIQKLFEKNDSLLLIHSPHSRFAFSEDHLFVNGVSYAAEEVFSQAICDKHITGPLTRNQQALLAELFNLGLITTA